MTTTNNIDAIDTSFVTLGFFRAGATTGLTNEECDRYEGEIGAVGQCADMAHILATATRVATCAGHEHTGVYAYEVCEPVGFELRTSRGDYNHMRRYIAATLAEYFIPDRTQRSGREQLRTAMLKELGLSS